MCSARSLCSDRVRAKAQSLRSDRTSIPLGRYVATKRSLSRYVATELERSLSRYVATELEPELGRHIATELEPKIGRYVATELFRNIDTTYANFGSHSWPGEADDPELVSLITDIHAGRFVKGFWEVQGNAKGKGNAKKMKMKGGVSSEAEPPTKKQKKVKTQNESEAAAAGKEKIDQIDSWLEAYELDRNRPLMDQKTIDDRVKALLEERLKDLGVGEILENNDNRSPPLPVVQTQQKSVNSPALAATPGKVFGPKKNLAKELDKESRVKRTLDEEFGNVAKATDLDSQPLDFVVISPAKATKDDKDAKVPAYGCGCRGNRIVKGEEADEKKKKAVQADAAFKRKEKAEDKKKVAEAKKKDAEAKKKEAEAKKKRG
ncbi:hypothetical protein F2Q69_00054899 [Brassica cretica]|uniref:Uncharacterized protein n=1 Tax=Brassica cretica TaxID=69181 RepID=A0A8S9MQD7_BRACR|nr:hypothetical protein F2Q69_00054899 [Brassica cretica]